MDETEQCEECGCGMVDHALGWRCAECGYLVEAEPARMFLNLQFN